MEPDDLGCLAGVEVAFDGVADLGAEFFEGFGLGEGGLAEGACGVTAFRRFFDVEDEFVHLV